MRRYPATVDSDCAIAHALGIVGDWWTLLVLRDLAGGLTRFGELAAAVGVSRKVLAERLNALVEQDIVSRTLYREHPPRYDYRLTDKGLGLLPVLIALQTWGERYVLGDGTLTATSAPEAFDTQRVHRLVGKALPSLSLPAGLGGAIDPVGATPWTVLYCFPGAWLSTVTGERPPGWASVPGAVGCTLESTTFRDRAGDFAEHGATIHGVSTQRPDHLTEFADHLRIPFALLSDQHLTLTSALRLPTFRMAGVERIKRITLIIDQARTIRAVLYPIVDPAASVTDALHLIETLAPLPLVM